MTIPALFSIIVHGDRADGGKTPNQVRSWESRQLVCVCVCVATQYFVLEKVEIWGGMGSYEFYEIGRISIKLLLGLW